MTRNEYTLFCGDSFGAKPEHPFKDDNETTVFRHDDNKKWFALLMKIPACRLGIEDDGIIDVVNLKCDPILSGSLFREGGVYPAYHMNKEKWISVVIGEVDEDKIKWLTSLSFELTAKKIKPRRKKPD